MAYDALKVDIRERVGLVELNRPQERNVINGAMLRELAEVFQRHESDESVAAIVIAGDEKFFSAGLDVAELREMSFAEAFKSEIYAAEWDAIAGLRKPIVAAVSGYAHGAGFELALMADFILAAPKAKFGFPELSLGVIPTAGGVQRLTRLVGRAKAMEMLLTGRNMDADEAERAGLVSRVVPAEDLLDAAMRAAAQIATKAPLAVLAAKEAASIAAETTLSEGLRAERRLLHALFATEDKREGMDAYVEQRTPQFRGR